MTIMKNRQTPEAVTTKALTNGNVFPKQKTAAEYLNDINEPRLVEMEARYRLDLDEKDLYNSAG